MRYYKSHYNYNKGERNMVKNIKRPHRKIYYTKDYDKFKFLPRNREIKEAHVKFLAYAHESPIEGNGNRIPIVVKWSQDRMNLFILEGQHRKEACRITNTPLSYYIDEDIDESDIAPLNTSQKPWKFNDYLKFHNHPDNPNQAAYQSIQKMMEDYKSFMTSKLCLCLMHGVDYQKLQYQSFKDGTFEITNLKEANQIAEELKRIHGAMNRKIPWFKFAVVYMKLRKEKNFSFKHALKNFTKNVDDYIDISIMIRFKVGMVDAYNKRLPKNQRINPPIYDE